MEGVLVVFIVFASITVWKFIQMQENIAVSRRGEAELEARVAGLEATVQQLRDMVADAVIDQHDAEQLRRLDADLDSARASLDAGRA